MVANLVQHDSSTDDLQKILEEIEKNESMLADGLLRVNELSVLVNSATYEYEFASDHNSIQYRKFDKSRRTHPHFTPHRPNGYAEPEDGAQLKEIKQAIVELLHTQGVEVEPNEVFIPAGQPFLGRLAIRNILSTAEISIDIKDDYLFSVNRKTKNVELLEILAPYLPAGSTIKVRLLGSSDELPGSVVSDVKTFLVQCPQAKFKGYSHTATGKRETHDRFIIIDGRQVYSTGASLKDSGIAQSAIAQVNDEAVSDKYIETFEEWWDKATDYKGL